MEFNMADQVFNLDNIVINKGPGKILTAVSADLKTNKVKVTGNVQSVPLSEIQNYSKVPLDLTGNLNGYFNLSLKDGLQGLESQIYLNNAKVATNTLPDSFVDLKLRKENIEIDANIFGDSLSLKSILNLNESAKSTKKKSEISLETNADNLNVLLGIFRGVDVVESNVNGNIQIKSKATFNLNKWQSFDGFLEIQKLNLEKGDILVDFESLGQPGVIVENGKIKLWNLDIRGRKFYLISKGQGDFKTQYNVDTKMKIDASIMEVFNKIISKSTGAIIGKIKNYKYNGKDDYEARFEVFTEKQA
jgi:hypothetical protein